MNILFLFTIVQTCSGINRLIWALSQSSTLSSLHWCMYH